jgi:alanine dehydrogenase
MKIALIKEGKTPPDERVVLTPEQVLEAQSTLSGIEFVVQRSTVRRITDDEYAAKDIQVVDDVSDCNVLLGVKEVRLDDLIPNKTYFFFSHTIKKQPYNRELLQTVLRKNITLIDYECLTRPNGARLIGFGRYAGIVGAYNAFYAWGRRTNTFTLKRAFQCHDRAELEGELDSLNKGDLPKRIVLTGAGRVAHGAMEILDHLKIRKVDPHAYVNGIFDEPVYTQLNVTDYVRRKDGTPAETQDFFNHPERYESNFMSYASCSDLYIACHFWKAGSPFIFTRQDAASPEFKVSTIADISCDIDGPVASTLRPSTIAEPLYGYDPQTQSETSFNDDTSITVMAVDNLPCELPRDASEDFGAEFLKEILPFLVGEDPENRIKRGTIAQGGKLTENFLYLTEYAEGRA